MTDLRLRAYAPNGADMGLLPAPTSQQASVPLNDVPALTVDYAPNAPRAELMGQPLELALEVSRDGNTWAEPPGCRFLYLRDGRDPLKTADSWKAEAPGYAWLLKKARLLDPGGWAVGGKRAQTSPTSVGFLMRLFIEEAQTRGALAGLGITWTYTHDSAGVPWPSDVTGEWEMGADYLAILTDFASKGQVDWRTNGRDLQLYVPDTALAVDRTIGATQVHVTPLTSGEAPFRRTWEGVAGWIISRGEGDAHYFHTNPETTEPWGRWEDYITNSGVTDEPTLQAYAERYGQTTDGPRLELTQSVELGTGPTPLLDYVPGDYIWTRNLTGVPTRYRVRQATITKDSGPPSGNLVLNDRFVEADIRTQRALEALTGGASSSGSSGPPPGADILPPAAPAQPSATPAYYMDDDTRVGHARVVLDWADVLTNMDGTAIADLSGYEVWMKRNATATWIKATDVTASQAELSGFDPGATWDFRARAVDQSGNLSDYSPTRTVAMPTDSTAPAVPSQPAASSRMGSVAITWDGKNNAGNPQAEPDLFRVEVHVSAVSGFVPTPGSSATMVGSLSGPGTVTTGTLAVGSTYYVRLVAVDTSLNASGPSVQRSVVVAPATLDGLAPVAPGGWTATLAPLGIMALKASWTPVTNQDAVEYDVYLSTASGFTTYDATTKVGSTAGTVLAINAKADGTALVAGTTYYVKVKARDVDGSSAASAQGSAQPRQVTNTDVAADYIYAGLLEADQINSGNLNASLAIIGELATAVIGGRRVSLSSEGLTVTGQDGSVLAFFPTDAARDINIRADLVANSITALGPVAMRSALNELAPNASLVMGAASSAPVTPPNVALDWATLGNNTSEFADWFRGANYYATGDRTYQAWWTYGASKVRAFSGTTGLSLGDLDPNVGLPELRFICHTAARVGDYLYVVVRDLGRSGDWYVRYYDMTASGVSLAGEWLLSGVGVLEGHEPAMTTDGTDLLFLIPFGDNVIRFQRRNRNTGALIGSQVTTEAVVAGGLWSMVYGAADVGATRVWFTSQQFPDQMLCYNPATGLRDADKEFPSAFGEAANGLWYDTTRGKFRSKSLASNRIYQYDGQTWAAESSVWYVSSTWRDTDAVGTLHETDQGPRSSFTMKKRATLVVTTPPIPTDPNNANHDDPTAVAIYVGRGDGTRTTQWRQSQPADGVTTVRLNSFLFSNADTLHPNPPAASDFPAGVPGRIQNQGGTYYFDGNGDVVGRTIKYATDVPRTALTLAGAWVNFGSGRDLASYEKVRGWVHLRGFIKSGAGTIGTLPPGCRPIVDASPFNTETLFTFTPVTSTAGNVLAPGLLNVNPTTGVITFEAGANAWVCLNGIRFRAQ